MELNEIKALLADRNMKVVAAGAGVDYFKLSRWMRGETQNPDYVLIVKLIKYLESTSLRVA